MRVDHRRADIGMAQQRLHRTDISAALQQMRREAVPQRVRAGRLDDAGCLPSCAPARALSLGIEMVPAPPAAMFRRWQGLPSTLTQRADVG